MRQTYVDTYGNVWDKSIDSLCQPDIHISEVPHISHSILSQMISYISRTFTGDQA